MEKMACELRVMDRQGGFPGAEVKATSIQGQKEKDAFQAEETRVAKEQGSKATWGVSRGGGTGHGVKERVGIEEE